MQFLSDNNASIHPALWDAMKAADQPDFPYDWDAASQSLKAVFTDLFGRDCAVLWVATGTAANCLALASLVQPYGAIVCHKEAHIEKDECGAPGFYTHGAKLLLADGKAAKLDPEGIQAMLDPINGTVHQVQAHAISITQASEYGCCYQPEEIAAIADLAKKHGLGLHMDGARFANACAFLGGSAKEAAQKAAGQVDTLSFGFIKNGGMNAEAIVFFDPEMAEAAKRRHKRAGHLQSKGRYLAAQLLAMLKDDLWLHNARSANAAAAEIASAAGDRLIHPVEANEIFLRCTSEERGALRMGGFAFYDWGDDAIRLVTAWNTPQEHAMALAKAISSL